MKEKYLTNARIIDPKKQFSDEVVWLPMEQGT